MTPRLLVMWLCTLLVTGLACTRRYVAPKEGAACCEGVDDCLAPLRHAKAPAGTDSGDVLTDDSRCVVYELAKMGPEVLPDLTALLSHPVPQVRGIAAEILVLLGNQNRDGVVSALLEAHQKDPRSSALGVLVELDDSRAAPLVRRFFQEGDGAKVVFQVEGFLDSFRDGSLSRVTRTPEGAWVLEPFVTLPGNPVAYAVDARGDLVIATTTRNAWSRGDPRCSDESGRCLHPFESACPVYPNSEIAHFVRVTRDGQLRFVE